jgi:exonuclease-1
MLQHFGVTPYMVFDGDFLPSKASTESHRAKRREESKKAGMELLKAGKASQAYSELQKAIDVTPEMARHLIEELKRVDVPYVVAPYEADAQLVYLERQGLINGIISEDSDLLVFGAKRLLTKLDQYGHCVEINRREFSAVREISLTGWTDAEFRHMAILSGCDYLEGLEKMGLKTAYRMLRKHKTPEKVVRMIQFEGKHRVPEGYLSAFKQAELTFLHQRVFCPLKQDIVLLTEPDTGVDPESMPFIGGALETELARGIALGEVNPISKQPINIHPTSPNKRRNSQLSSSASLRVTSGQPVGKTIESFFEGHRRIPLGEMDPNCFVVNPRVTRAGGQEGASPPVISLPRPYVDETSALPGAARHQVAPRNVRRRTEPVESLINLRNMPTISGSRRRTTSSIGPKLTPRIFRDPEPSISGAQEDSMPSTRPPKKQRLCEDLLANDVQGVEPKQSRFFSSNIDKSSKSVDGLKAAPVSENSIDEIFRRQTDGGYLTTPGGRKGINVFRDYHNAGGAKQLDNVNKGVNSTTGPQIKMSPSPESLSQERDSPEKSQAKPISHTRFSLQHFSNPASARPTAVSSSSRTKFIHGLPTPCSTIQKPSSANDLVAARLHPATPLQRLGAQALQRSKVVKGPSEDTRTSTGNRGGRLGIVNFPLNPAFIPLPKVDLAEIKSLNQPYGSEDQIIPDHDIENEDPHPDGPLSRGTQLDLSRFMYT